MKNTALIAIAALTLTACQSVPSTPIIQRTDMTYETSAFGKSKQIAQQKALDSAKKQCLTRQPIILKDELRYHGVLTERANKLLDTTAAVVGSVLGTNTPSLSRHDDYEYSIKFRCR